MEEIMTRIAEALERVEAIHNEGKENAQQYQQLRKDLNETIIKALQQQKPIQNSLDAQKFAAHVLPPLVQGLPDAKQVQAAGAELINQIRAERERIPVKITIQGDFYGFTSWKPLTLYSSLLILCGALCTYFWYQKQETVQYQQATELLKERNYLHDQIEAYRAKYPKYAELFPPYNDGGFWARNNNHLTEPQAQR